SRSIVLDHPQTGQAYARDNSESDQMAQDVPGCLDDVDSGVGHTDGTVSTPPATRLRRHRTGAVSHGPESPGATASGLACSPDRVARRALRPGAATGSRPVVRTGSGS